MHPIPDEVRRFILTSIPSVPFLEAALLMRARPGRTCTAAEVATSLYVAERTAADLLKALCDAGIVECSDPSDGRYWYAPREPTLDAALGELAAAYARDLVGVTTLIHDATRRNAERFADAFRLRREK
jgi:hypothetical protein